MTLNHLGPRDPRLDAVTAQHEVRVPEGTGWYVYRGIECQGGPFESEDEALDLGTLLCDATTDQMDRFDSAARAAGHPSGLSAANGLGLWGGTVAEAIALVGEQEECE